MKLIFAFALFAAFAFVLFGWGWTVRRILRARATNWPAAIAAGVGALVFLGGLLNLARLAYPLAFACLAVAGVALGVTAVLRDRPGLRAGAPLWIPLILAAAILAFAVETQLPPKAYNFHDDYEKYFGHVTRMLETGSVFGSPLNDIGLDTIGGQAFLDGFAVAFFPIRYINGIDAVFGLFACTMLASAFTKSRGDLLPISVLCLLSVLFINPQYVNTSALYTGALLIMALFEDEGSSAAVTGLLWAALIALKSTFALFVLLHVIVALIVRGLRWTAGATAALALFFSPWVLVHAPHYVAILRAGLGVGAAASRPIEPFNIFSRMPLDYGSSPANYTWLMIAIALCGALIALARRKVDMTAASCLAMLPAYLIMIYLSGPRNAGYEQAIRYFAAFAIGSAPAAFGSAALALAGFNWSRWWKIGVPFVLGAGPLLAFAPSLRDRAEEAVHSGSILAFSWLAPDPDYLAYNREVLYGDMHQRVTAAQAKVPAGEEVVVWINTPFYLDYARNRVADVEPGAGLIAPWSKMPDASYFIWEYGGYANVDEAEYAKDMADGPDLLQSVSAARWNMSRRLAGIEERSQKLYDDGSIVVFRSGGARSAE